MPPQPHAVFTLPSDFDILVRVLLYAVGTVLSALGGFHGYRGYRRFRGMPFGKETEQVRDEFVFGDDLDKMYNENPVKIDGDDAYKQALAGDVNAEQVMKRRVLAAAQSPPDQK